MKVNPKAQNKHAKGGKQRGRESLFEDDQGGLLFEIPGKAWKNRRRIRWNTLRIFSGRERRRGSRIVRCSITANVGQSPRPPLLKAAIRSVLADAVILDEFLKMNPTLGWLLVERRIRSEKVPEVFSSLESH